VRHLTYLGLLAACLIGTLPLELVLGARVYRRWRRAVLAVLPVAAVFVLWDGLAVHAHWWTFDRRYLVGVWLGLPLEELLFFLVIPVCALLTLEGVRRVRPDWTVGDEATRDRRPDRP
jgi:lycopene beta-cyclase